MNSKIKNKPFMPSEKELLATGMFARMLVFAYHQYRSYDIMECENQEYI